MKLFTLLFLLYFEVHAMAPPAYFKLCEVKGEVMETYSEGGCISAEDPKIDGKCFSIEKIKLRIDEIKESSLKEPSFVDCKKIKIGEMVHYKDCDHFAVKKGQKISGLVGRAEGRDFCIHKLAGASR